MEQDKINAYMTLYTALVTVAKAAAPMIPFMTEDIYQNLVRTVDKDAPLSIHLCDFPEVKEEMIDPQLEKDPIDMDGRKLYFYDNFERVMREDMTLEEYCTLLNEYWGFDGYTISGTKYADYGYDTQPPAGDTLMKELMDQPFVTLYFEGDQEGMPMFLEGNYFPEDTHFNFGFFHMVG